MEAIRDFCERELGTREQRERADQRLHRAPHQRDLREDRRARLARRLDRRGVRRRGRRRSSTSACSSRRPMRGLVPIAGFRVSLIVAGAYERFGTEEQKQEILGGISAGRVEAIAMSEPEAGSDVGNLSCRAERQNGGFVLNGQKTWISAAHIADHILVVARTDRDGLQARGPDDALGPDRRRGDRDPRDRDDGRPGGQRRLPHRLRRARGARPRPGRRRLDAADGRAQRRAPDHSPRASSGSPSGPSTTRSPTSRSASSSAARSAPSRRSSTGSPTWRPRSSAAGCWSTTSPARSTPTPTRCSRARPRWRS